MSEPMTPLEKMARAVCRSFYSHDENEPRLTAIVDGEWQDWVGEARAALLAIREPDEGMVVLIERHVDNQYPIDRFDGLDLWHEVLDHVLESGS